MYDCGVTFPRDPGMATYCSLITANHGIYMYDCGVFEWEFKELFLSVRGVIGREASFLLRLHFSHQEGKTETRLYSVL